MKKNLLFGLIAAFTFSACVKQEIIEIPPQQEMTFNTFINKAITGTRATNDLQRICTNFGVWGYYTESTLEPQSQNWKQTTRVFEHQRTNNESHEIKLDHNTRSWNYAPVENWVSNKRYRFYAYAPFQIRVDGKEQKIVAEHQKSGNIQFPDFTVPGTSKTEKVPYSEKEKQIDLLVSQYSERDTRSFNNSAIELNFSHVLTNVNLEFKTTSTHPIEITYVELQQVYTRANGKISISEENEILTNWSDFRDSRSFLGDCPKTYLINSTAPNPGEGVTSLISMENMYMIPQGFAEEPLTLLVRYRIGDPSEGDFREEMEKQVILSDDTDAWRPGARVTYRLIIQGEQEISFGNVTVGDWQDQNYETNIGVP